MTASGERRSALAVGYGSIRAAASGDVVVCLKSSICIVCPGVCSLLSARPPAGFFVAFLSSSQN